MKRLWLIALVCSLSACWPAPRPAELDILCKPPNQVVVTALKKPTLVFSTTSKILNYQTDPVTTCKLTATVANGEDTGLTCPVNGESLKVTAQVDLSGQTTLGVSAQVVDGFTPVTAPLAKKCFDTQ
jgi:hypothetical protein